jgi:high affinity sulfate transporter 1
MRRSGPELAGRGRGGQPVERRWWPWARFEGPSLPIRVWLPRYERRWLRPDLVAAAAVWAVLVPEGMAYASLAGLPPETGLFAALAPLLLYAVLGTSRQLTVGPSSAIAAFSAAAVAPLAGGDADRFIALSALLALITGAILLVAGLARLGFVADFFARPVLTGFVGGLALVIGVGQAHKLLGVEGGGTTFFGKLEHLLRQLDAVDATTLALGLAALALIFGLRAVAPRIPGALVAVVLGTAVVAALGLDESGVRVVGELPSGLPGFALPSFGLSDVSTLAPEAVALALVAFAESVAGARSFAAEHGYDVDADQELVALGASNLGAGVLQGFVVDASLSRTAVADSSGARTQVYNIVLFVLLVVTMLVLMPLFRDLPEAVLGAIVIAAVAHFVDVAAMRRLWRVDRTDFLLAISSFAGVLVFGILIGLLVAVVVSLLAIVYRAYRPAFAVLGRAPGALDDESLRYRGVDDHPEYETFPGLVILRVDGELFFANARWFEGTVRALVDDATPPVREVLVHAGAVPHIDTSAADVLRGLVGDLRERGVELAFARVTTSLFEHLERNGVVDVVGPERFHDTVAGGVADFLAREREPADRGRAGAAAGPQPRGSRGRDRRA